MRIKDRKLLMQRFEENGKIIVVLDGRKRIFRCSSGLIATILSFYLFVCWIFEFDLKWEKLKEWHQLLLIILNDSNEIEIYYSRNLYDIYLLLLPTGNQTGQSEILLTSRVNWMHYIIRQMIFNSQWFLTTFGYFRIAVVPHLMLG